MKRSDIIFPGIYRYKYLDVTVFFNDTHEPKGLVIHSNDAYHKCGMYSDYWNIIDSCSNWEVETNRNTSFDMGI